MPAPPARKRFSLRLGTKSSLAVVTLLSTISIALTTFFIARQRDQLTEELRKRAFSLASNLAYINQYPVLSQDLRSMQVSISGVEQESDIEQAYIIDLQGVIIAHRDSAMIGRRVPYSARLDSSLPRQWLPTERENIWRTVELIEIERHQTESDETTLFSSPRNSSNVNASPGSSYLEELGYVVLEVSLESMNRAVAAGTRRAVLITLVMLFAGALATVYMVRKVAVPIYRLVDATKRVAEDDLDQEVKVGRSDEIGVLASSFNHMTRQLKVSRARIEAWNRELEAKVAARTRELEDKHYELERAYEALKTLDKAKDDFLSLVSHELRTPLSSVLLYSEMLLDGMDDSKNTRKEFLAIIVENCRRLTRLINDVLDLSKIEAGRMPFKLVELEFENIVAETLSGLRPTIDAKRIKFSSRVLDRGFRLWGDRDKVIQVLTNVISNAAKFTPELGSVAITLESNGRMGRISVRDTGKGIRKEDIPKVFERFSHLESIDYHTEGSGLGMTISKSILEKLNGEIWIESEVGVGTTVFITLPKADQRLDSKTKEEPADAKREEKDTDRG